MNRDAGRSTFPSGCGWAFIATVLLAVIVVPGNAAAQPFAPFDHWARGALRRLALDGGVEAAFATVAWPVPESSIAALFADAAMSPSALGSRAASYAERFDDERRGTMRERGIEIAARVELGWRLRDDVVRAGVAMPTPSGFDDPGPVALDDRSEGFLRPQLDATSGFAALRITGEVMGDEVALGESFVTAAFGVVHAWAGRRGLSMGSTGRGGVVLGDAVAFDGGGIATPAGFTLPGFLRALGDVRVDQLVARMERSGDVRHPWFVATRLSFAPSSRLALGFNRAALFGGEGNEAVTARRVLLMLVGLTDVGGKDSDFENQVASVDVYWTPPAPFPIAVYAEYAADDAGRAFLNVPAIIVGIESAPRAGSEWSAAIEHVRFEPRAGSTYPKWYRHGALGEGWTDRGMPLGWPIGGHGRETTLALRFDAPERGVLGSLRLSARHRGAENLFAPDRAGSAAAAALEAVWFARRRLRVTATAEGESGDGWETARARIGVVGVF